MPIGSVNRAGTRTCVVTRVVTVRRDELTMNPTTIFAPASTSADVIFSLSMFVCIVAAAIFVVVASLIAVAVVRFRRSGGESASEPPQVDFSENRGLRGGLSAMRHVFSLARGGYFRNGWAIFHSGNAYPPIEALS